MTVDYDEIKFEFAMTRPGLESIGPKCGMYSGSRPRRMTHALASTRNDPTIVAAVVYGVGGHFSAGRDFHAMMKLNKANSYMWNDRMLKVGMTCRNLPIPVITMVEACGIPSTPS